MQEQRRSAEDIIGAWKSAGMLEVTDDLKVIFGDLVRRQVGVLLRRDGPMVSINPDTLAADLTETWGADLDSVRKQALGKSIASIANVVLVDQEPKEVTRWLWIWDRKAPDAKEIEQQLFAAIEDHLRKRLGRILHLQRFANLHHKIDQGDLVSELYLKLAKTKIPRLPENRRQFFGLVDKAILGILLDMQKAAACRPKTAKNELLDIHADKRTGQDQLKILLDAEDAEQQLAKRVEMEKRLDTLKPVQQEAFRLRRNGVSIAEIVDITGVSRAQIGRYIRQTKAFLGEALSSDT